MTTACPGVLTSERLSSDTASFELFDMEWLRVNLVTRVDIQDEVKCGLVTFCTWKTSCCGTT